MPQAASDGRSNTIKLNPIDISHLTSALSPSDRSNFKHNFLTLATRGSVQSIAAAVVASTSSQGSRESSQ